MSESPSWNRALTLLERDFIYPRDFVPSGFDAELADQRMETWKKESALLVDEQFTLRLEKLGIDASRFSHLLGSPAPPLDDVPQWLVELQAAYSEENPRKAIDGPEAPEDLWLSAVEEQPDAIFLDVVRPLLDSAWRRLKSRLASLELEASSTFDAEAFSRLWAKPLPEQLLWMVSRTLILELYLCRLQGILEGVTPEQRFESFLAALREPAGTLGLLETYPVLGRSLAIRISQWLETGGELAERLSTDLPILETSFCKASADEGSLRESSLGTLVDLKPGLGDRHESGRTVAALEFSSGVKVVYKPRSLALDVEFQHLLQWLGEQGVEPGFRTLEILDRGSYGWIELVVATPCRSRAEIERFYARQGAYLALLYALEATDFHYENLIAVGEHPVLIDLETLFMPVLEDADLGRERLNPVFTTVLRSGLLPRGPGGEAGVDLSGLGATRGQITPARELTRVGTDEMGFTDTENELAVGDHLPTLSGEEVTLLAVGDVLIESFRTTYRKLVALRPEFLRPGGRLDRFKGMETRVLVRATDLYARLMYSCFHPDYLQDSLHRERFLDKLWLDGERFEYLPKLIETERRDLLRGDFPRFNTRTDSRDLFSDDFLAADLLPESGLDLTRRRLISMGEVDLERQLLLIRLSLISTRPAGVAPEVDAQAVKELPVPVGDASPQSSDFLAGAIGVGERLETLMFRASKWVSWFHLSPSPDGSQALQAVGYDLYSGLGGIALFYAQLGQLTGESRWTELARSTATTAQELFDRESAEQNIRLGGYSGLGGWIYTLVSLGVLWDEPELLDAAESARDFVMPAIADDEGLDIIAGSAGCIAGLLELYRHRPSAETLAAAVACGDHLLSRSEAQEHGRAWRIASMAELPLTGFAHGTAGMVWALARLAAQSGEARFAEEARSGLAYERSLFLPEHGNWPDLRLDRQTDEGQASFFAWCHGAPGIGLSRLTLLDVMPDPEQESEIRAASRSTHRHGFGGSQCLCHGDLGNLELLMRAGERFDDPALLGAAQKLGGAILAGLDRDGYRCGISSPVELPGLMTGLAGIGYGLLRLAAPEVPSVLLLETPGVT